jgi:Na+/proline symporter
MQLVQLDWLIIALYFLIALVIGLYFSKRAGSDIDSFFVSNRSMPWWLLGTSMVATTFSADTPNLVTDIVRSQGVKGNWVWWAFLLTGMCTVFIYAKLWRRSGALTDMAFYELRYSGRPAAFLRGFRAIYLGVFFNIVIMATVNLAAIKIGGLLLGLDKYSTVIVCAAVATAYSALSGLWGVVVTDLLLFGIAMGGSITAAYYALNHPQVGGISGLISHESLQGSLDFLPDFTDWDVALTVLVIPLAVQWWSTWYPGAEPGGGGYVAQRMLAAKNEKHALVATLWFNVAHYGLRPWPWIIVALCSLIVYPDLDSIREAFPGVDPSIVKNDLAYPAMLVFLPQGLLGLVVASLAAAYMSTISTHLNWGASYVVDDVYRRFIRVEASDRHYVVVARLITMGLIILASALSLGLSNSLQGFQILLQVGAGTGLIFLLRWFWWRINAWSEISAMVVSFGVAIYFQFFHSVLGFNHVSNSFQLVSGVLITSSVWLLITYLTPPTDQATLQKYYDKIHPGGRSWGKVVEIDVSAEQESFLPGIICWFLGVAGTYSVLFGVGYLLYGDVIPGIFLLLVSLSSAILIMRLFPRLKIME